MWVIGLDGGGSKTACAIIDERLRVLGWGLSGPASPTFIPRPQARAHARQAVREARARCPRPRQAIAAACFTHASGALLPPLPGVEWQPAAEGVPASRWTLPGGTGVVLIAGTGSTAWAYREGKVVYGAGGAGFPLGDEGGAADIGMRAIQAIYRAEDGRAPATTLTGLLLARLGITRAHDLVRLYHFERCLQRHQLARLAPLVTRAAAEGDAVARRILHHTTAELAQAVGAAARGAALERPYTVAMIGGLAHAGPVLLRPLRQALRRWAPGARLRPARLTNVFSVALVALAGAGVEVGPAHARRLAANVRAAGLQGWPLPEDIMEADN